MGVIAEDTKTLIWSPAVRTRSNSTGTQLLHWLFLTILFSLFRVARRTRFQRSGSCSHRSWRPSCERIASTRSISTSARLVRLPRKTFERVERFWVGRLSRFNVVSFLNSDSSCSTAGEHTWKQRGCGFDSYQVIGFLSVAIGQRPRNYLSCCCPCSPFGSFLH